MEAKTANANVDNSVGMSIPAGEPTPMETDGMANNQEPASESHGLNDKPMAAIETPTDNQQHHQHMLGKSDANQMADAFNHNAPNDALTNNTLALAAASIQDQFDFAHDNLATLAAVSAAGAEALLKPIASNPPTQQTPMDSMNSNNQAANDQQTTPAVTTPKTPTQAVSPATPIAAAPPPPAPPAPPINEEDAKWHSVGIFQGLSTAVSNYIDNSVWTSSGLSLNADEIPDLTQFERINLEPGTAYRFRIRALNSIGASDWSEISSFKTCLPGFPGAPSAIKISKSSEGAHLTWEPPPSCVSSNEIMEYSVYLAVKPGKEKEAKAGARASAQLAFVRVYVGAANQCTVSHISLAAAHVDCSNKPAIIFRIAARNEKGYGPATQVRWLQDPVQNSGTNPGLGGNSLLSPTRAKPDIGGASPSKRFKAGTGR